MTRLFCARTEFTIEAKLLEFPFTDGLDLQFHPAGLILASFTACRVVRVATVINVTNAAATDQLAHFHDVHEVVVV